MTSLEEPAIGLASDDVQGSDDYQRPTSFVSNTSPRESSVGPSATGSAADSAQFSNLQRNSQQTSDSYTKLSRPGSDDQEGSTLSFLDSVIAAESKDHAVDIPHSQKLVNEERPNDYSELSTFACVCNVLVGLVALNFSLRSKESWQAGDYKAAKRYGCAACVTSLFALLAVLAIVVYVLKEEDIIDW